MRLLVSIALLVCGFTHAAAHPPCPVVSDVWRDAATTCDRKATPDSDWIEWIEFCGAGDDGTLYMKVTSGKKREYRYAQVPAELWRRFRAAPSPGRFFNEEIGGVFACGRRAGPWD